MTLSKELIDATPALSLEKLADTEKPDSLIQWRKPETIRAELLPVRSLTSDMLPEPLRPWILDVSYRMQCPPDFIAASAIIMLSTVIGAGCAIKPKRHDDWIVIPNLWGGIVGGPGTMKSPAIATTFGLLSAIEAKAFADFDADLRAYSAELQAFEATKSALKDQMKAAAKAASKKSNGQDFTMDQLKEKSRIIESPKKPPCKRFTTNDASIEKISEIESENPRGLTVLVDELMRLLLSFERDGHQQDRAFYLEGWNGYSTFTIDRIGRGTIRVENHCLGVFGGIQPQKLLGYLLQAARGSDNDGLLQRFQVLVYPDDTLERKFIDQEPDRIARERVVQLIEAMAGMNFLKCGANKEQGDRFAWFQFDDNAQDWFKHWLTELERKLQATNEEPMLIEHLSKYRKLMPALALIFHLVNIAGCDDVAQSRVSLDSAEMAGRWCDYLEDHARRIYGQIAGTGMRAALKLAEKIRQGELQDGFSIRDVYRNQWQYLTDREVVKEACDELVEAGWLAEQILDPGFQQRSKTAYLINPLIHKTKDQKFELHRKAN